MKRAGLLIVGAGIASVVLMWALQAQEQQAQTSPATTTPAPERIAFTFKDDTQMQEFAKAWRGREAIITKMAVLQSYLTQEQPSLAQVNQELLTQYNLDVTKNYTLDAQRKVLIEHEAPPQQGAQAAATLAAPSATP